MSPSCTLRRHRLAMTLLLLVMGGFPVATMAENAGKQPSGEKTKTESKETKNSSATASTAPAPTQGLLAFGKLLPVGQKHKELEIPNFKNGAPSSMVQAEVMTRMDEENMFLEDMNIWMYGPPGEAEKDLRVQLRTATFHMPSSIIASDEPSRISRADFDLQGDTLIFDPATGQGKMMGNVKMVIHDSSSFAKSPGDESAAPREKKATKKGADGLEEVPNSPTSPTAGSSPATTTRSATAPRLKSGAGSGAAPTTQSKK